MTVEDFRYGLSLNDLFHEHLLAIDDDYTLVAVVNLLAREVVANGVLVLNEVHVLDAGSLSQQISLGDGDRSTSGQLKSNLVDGNFTSL